MPFDYLESSLCRKRPQEKRFLRASFFAEKRECFSVKRICKQVKLSNKNNPQYSGVTYGIVASFFQTMKEKAVIINAERYQTMIFCKPIQKKQIFLTGPCHVSQFWLLLIYFKKVSANIISLEPHWSTRTHHGQWGDRGNQHGSLHKWN